MQAKNKTLVIQLGFIPKENSSGIFHKKYDGYALEVDFEKEIFNFGGKIKFSESDKTIQNIVKPEDWVVLECVDRLLEKGYDPKNITLEKTWKTGHGTSGRLDILVSNEDGTAYLMIECKTWGGEYEKENKNLVKNGGQLFTYFQQDKNADVIMLYTSTLNGSKVEYKNEIIKIEEDYRLTANVKDLYDRWSKLSKQNGVFEKWCVPYSFESKALTPKDLEEIKQEDSSFIFNQFLEILRHNVVSDKPNAFNKIFTLFLCKIYDEKYTNPGEELAFQWFYGSFTYEGIRYAKDTHIVFQKRLTDLYKRGMNAFLEKDVTDISDAEFDKKYEHLDETDRITLKDAFTEIRLKKNNEFAIKEVFNDESFEENAKVVKEVVELLQGYKIRYTKKQQYLSDFFELLLTTGLKQESGQYFTPVPIAQFVIKSLPLDKIVLDKLSNGKPDEDNLLPYIIDNASGSGHFITESMHEIQSVLNKIDPKDYAPATEKKLQNWQTDHFDWALNYVYGVEKDYRLVKVGKVGCYLHGDGLAKIIHSDGLASFVNSTDYKGKLKEVNKDFPQDNNQFDILVSNPPYSVSSFRNNARKYYQDEDFSLYNKLTDNSSEIECLFIERTKQLLKEGGVTGMILPSSILSNTGIYTKTRELILLNFEIVAITELGSNTFMATDTNTVVLFLRKRDNYFAQGLSKKVTKALNEAKDVTLNGVENSLTKYINHVWEGISMADYETLLKNEPNTTIQEHEIYIEYIKKVKGKDDNAVWEAIIALEQDKLFYFALAFPQRLVVVKTGSKNEEKRFLGYEFSTRRGSEGIHPLQRNKSIDECTHLYDTDSYTNPDKASTYIYKAFSGEYDLDLPENLQKNISYHNLIDMFTWDRVDFEKNISLTIKKKIIIPSKFPQEKVENLFLQINNGKNVRQIDSKGKFRVSRIESIADAYFNLNATKWTNDNINEKDFLQKGDILLSHINSVNHLGKSALFNLDEKIVHGVNLLKFRPDSKIVIPKYVSLIFKTNVFITEIQKYAIKAANQASLNSTNIKNLKIPLPPLNIQEKIVAEIENLEDKEQKSIEEVEGLREEIKNSFAKGEGELKRLDKICDLKAGDFVKAGDILKEYSPGLYSCYGGNGLRGYTTTFTNEGDYSLVGRQGALCGNVHRVSGKFHATEHALVAYPKDEVNNLWLHYQLLFMNLNQYATGTAQPGLSVMNLNPIEIPLPPLSEQEKIVAAIEKLESKIETLEKELSLIPMEKEAVLKKYL